jgi:hypothetical protein
VRVGSGGSGFAAERDPARPASGKSAGGISMSREAVRIVRGLGRREMKYVLPSEAVAAAVVDRIQPFTAPDPHAVDSPRFRYGLASLYLDTAALDLYMDTVCGEKNRHKLRIRHYEQPGSPVFFEVKSKVNEVILKRRAAVYPEAVADLVAGAVPRRSHVVGGGTDQLANLLWFRDFAQACGAVPTAWVRYVREPRASLAGDDVRITFDRAVSCSPARSPDPVAHPVEWYPAADLPVILEVKFGNTYPRWVAAMIAEFDLVRTSVPKYVLSVDSCCRLGLLSPERRVKVIR